MTLKTVSRDHYGILCIVFQFKLLVKRWPFNCHLYIDCLCIWLWISDYEPMLVIALFYIYSNCLMAIIPQYARNIKPFWILLQQEMMQVAIRNGDRTQTQQEWTKPKLRFCQEPNPKVKIVQESELNPTPQRTRTQMSWFLLDSFTEWSCTYISQ